MTLAGDDPRHGTRSAYVYYRCRCRPCVDADTEYHRKRQRRGVCADCGKQISSNAAYPAKRCSLCAAKDRVRRGINGRQENAEYARKLSRRGTDWSAWVCG